MKFLPRLRAPCPFWSSITLHSLWLHGAWEVAQCRLFYDMRGVPPTPAALFMIGATGADVVLTLALVALAFLLARRRSVGVTPHVLGALVVLGAGAAILIETLALTLGWWRYSSTMPIIPVGRDIGLLPVLQMALLPSVAFLLARSPFTSK